MPIVPKAERSVRPRAPVVRTPDVGGTVPGAFGEDVAKAQIELGATGVKAGTTLLQHMARQKYYRDQEIGDSQGNKLNDFVTNSLYSTEEVDIDIPSADGTSVSAKVQKGYLNRQNHAAFGSYEGLKNDLETRKSEDIAALGDNATAINRYMARYNSVYKTSLKSTLAHEATEARSGARNTIYETVAQELTKLPALTDEERKETVAGVDKRFDEGYASGLFTFEQVQNGKDTFRYGVFLTDYKKDDIPPVILEEKLKTNAYGLSVEKLKKATTLYNTEKTRIKNEREEELDQMAFDNTLNEQTIDLYVIEGRIKPKSGTTRKAALIAEEAKNPDPFAYNSIVERAESVETMGERWYWHTRTQKEKEERFREASTLRNDVLRMRTEGKLTKDESSEILKKMGNAIEDFAPYKEGIVEIKQFANRNYGPAERDKVKKLLYQDFMQKIDNKVDPVKAVKDVKRNLYPGYKFEDLELTAKETGFTVNQVYKILLNKKK